MSSEKKLSNNQAAAAVRYNQGRKLSDDLITQVLSLLEQEPGHGLDEAASQAIAAWQAAEGLGVDGKLGPRTLELMEREWDHDGRDEHDEHDDGGGSEPKPMTSSKQISDIGGFAVVDHRGAKRTKKRGKPGKSQPRKYATITGITLHQTACLYGNPEQPSVLNVPAHAMVFGDGRIALLNRAAAYMYHGNGLNRSDIGIEINCMAAGIEGNSATLWRPASKPKLEASEATDKQLAATKALVRYYVELVSREGGKIEHVHAHRQSKKEKPSDPGSKIWRAIGVWAQEEFGLTSSTKGLRKSSSDGTCLDEGSPIPTAWDPRIEGVPYNWKIKGY